MRLHDALSILFKKAKRRGSIARIGWYLLYTDVCMYDSVVDMCRLSQLKPVTDRDYVHGASQAHKSPTTDESYA